MFATVLLLILGVAHAIPADPRYALLEATKGELTRRQLLGGGDDFAPYEMPCPEGYTWIRSADVSVTIPAIGSCIKAVAID
jgi:hypothetical protein